MNIDAVHELTPDVMELLVGLNARSAIAAFMSKFKAMFPHISSKVEASAALFLKLWLKVQRGAIFPSDFVRGHWLRTVASYTQAVLELNQEVFSSRKICLALGTYKYGEMGRNMDVDVAIPVATDRSYSLDRIELRDRWYRKMKVRNARKGKQSSSGLSTDCVAFVLSSKNPTFYATATLESSFSKPMIREEKEESITKRRRILPSSK